MKKVNTIPKENEEKKTKPNKTSKYAIPIALCFIILICCYFFFCNKKSNKSVFDETTLKNQKLKSRVFLGPITHLPEKMEAVVKNGVALITTEGCIVGDYSFSKLQAEGPFRIDNDEYIPELKK